MFFDSLNLGPVSKRAGGNPKFGKEAASTYNKTELAPTNKQTLSVVSGASKYRGAKKYLGFSFSITILYLSPKQVKILEEQLQ